MPEKCDGNLNCRQDEEDNANGNKHAKILTLCPHTPTIVLIDLALLLIVLAWRSLLTNLILLLLRLSLIWQVHRYIFKCQKNNELQDV